MQQAGTRTQPDAAHLRILMLIYSTALEVTEPSAQFGPAMLAKSQRLQTVALGPDRIRPAFGVESVATHCAAVVFSGSVSGES